MPDDWKEQLVKYLSKYSPNLDEELIEDLSYDFLEFFDRICTELYIIREGIFAIIFKMEESKSATQGERI
uniref:Uncharacterized protein n=1 Tax=Fervidobacterium pennivorans TaxID=93466 RepID=A0A832MW01_FERPE